MSDSHASDRSADPGRDGGGDPDAPGLDRRRFLAAGLTGAPLILTVRARAAWARRRHTDTTDTAETRGETGEEDSAALSGDPSEAPEA
jgi:hypothetical protein